MLPVMMFLLADFVKELQEEIVVISNQKKAIEEEERFSGKSAYNVTY